MDSARAVRLLATDHAAERGGAARAHGPGAPWVAVEKWRLSPT